MINFFEKQDKGTGLSPALMNRYKKAASQSNYVANQRYGRISSTSGLSKKYKDSKLSDQQKVMKKRDKGLNMAAKKTGTWGQQEETMTAADAGIPQDTKNMGPSRLPMHILRRKLGLPIHVTDRRVSKKKPPRLKKKFKFS